MIINLYLSFWEFNEEIQCDSFTFDCNTYALNIYGIKNKIDIPRKIFKTEKEDNITIKLIGEDFFHVETV